MAQRRAQRNAQSQDLAPFVLAAGLPGLIVAEWYGFPGVPAAWLAVLLAVMMMSQPALTGPKDQSGYPVAANPAETRKLTRYRAGAEMRVALFLPYRDLAPGRPVRAAWISSVFVAIVAFLLPVIGNKHITPSSAHLANALFALVLVLASTGSLRRARGQDNPGVRFDTWREFQRNRSPFLIGLIAIIGLALGAVLGVVLLAVDAKYGSGFGAHTLATPPAKHPGLMVASNAPVIISLAIAGAWFAVLSSWRKSAMSGYVEMTNVRAQWNYRWTSLKYDITPVVVDHRVLDSHVTVDTLDAPGHLGALEFIRNESRLAPLLAPGERVALLSVPDHAGRLGSRSAIRFLAVTWPQSYDVTSASADVELVTLWAQSGLAWVSRARGVHQEPLPESVMEVHDAIVDIDQDAVQFTHDVPAPSPHRSRWREFWQQVKDASPTTSTLEAALNQETIDPPVNGSEVIPSNSRLWRITWYYDASTIGPQLFRNDALDEIALALNTQVLIDHRDNGTMYIGHLDNDDIPDDIDHALTKVRTEDLWRRIWTTCVKSGANLPVPQLGSLGEESLENGSTVHRMAFVLNLGNEPLDYKYPGVESKLKSALGTGRTSGASFVAVTGHPDYKNGGRPGDRHPQVICVLWSFDPVPRTPTSLAPSGTSADEWVLAGLVNDAFSSLKLAHPEVAGVRCLTKRSARRHAWEVQLRLYGAVTTGAVRSAASKISEILAAPWVRVADAPDGCVLYLGDEPDDSDLASSRDAALVASLDWEQAFLVSHVVGSAGAVPILTSTSHMPSNPMVKVLEFELPPGLDKFTVKMAAGKLRTATGNVYLSVQDSDNGPTFLIIQASRENPLPVMVPFNFDAADTSLGMAFATGVDGEPIEFEPERDIHLAIIGMTGSGKSVAAQAILYGAAIKQYEVYVIDPTKAAADFRFLEPYARAMAVDVHSAAATLRAIYTEVERRKELNSRYAASSINDLPDDVRPSPILVFIDEFTSLIASEKVPSRSFDDADLERERIAQKRVSDDRMAIAIFTGKLAREARSAGVSLVLGTQKLMADSLKNVPNGGDLKTNLSRLLLGSTSQGERMSALRAFDQAPDPGEIVPKGRGIWESSVRTGVLMQGWFAPVSALGEALAERVDPLDLSDRLDLTGYFSAADTSTFMDTEEVIDLGEMEIDLTDFLDDETDTPAEEPQRSAKRDAWQIDWSAPDGTHGETPAPIDEDDPFSKPAPRRRLTPQDDDDPFA